MRRQGARGARRRCARSQLLRRPDALPARLGALAALTERLDVIEAYLVAVQDGRQAPDRATLSAIAAAVDAVPAREEDVASVLSQDILRVRRGRQSAPAARRRTLATARAPTAPLPLPPAPPPSPPPRPALRRARATA